MSVVVAVPGSLQQPVSLLLPDTNVNAVFTHPIGSANATVIGIIITNADSSAQKTEIWWNDGTTDFLIFVRSVAANETVTVSLDAPLQFYPKQSAKQINARAAAADKVTVTVIHTLASQQRPSNVG